MKSFMGLQLPLIYQDHLKFFPNKCMIAMCTYNMLYETKVQNDGILYDTIYAMIELFRAETFSSQISDFPMLFVFGDLLTSKTFLVVLFVFLLIGIFSRERKISKATKLMTYIDQILLHLGHIFPGVIWMVKRQGVRSLLFFITTVCCLCAFFLDFHDGGVLTALAVPKMPFVSSINDIAFWYIDVFSSIAVFVLLTSMIYSVYTWRRSIAK